MKNLLLIMFLGQFLSILLTSSNIFTKLLADQAIPAIQTFLNYNLLLIVYLPYILYKRGWRGFLEILIKRGFYCKNFF
jgi:solute carrier family 35 protein F1/2